MNLRTPYPEENIPPNSTASEFLSPRRLGSFYFPCFPLVRMVWVRSEYAGELAVVFAWLAALLPWNVTYSTLPGLGSALFVRFPFVQVRYAFGLPVAKATAVRSPLGALELQAGRAVAVGYQAWVVGAAVVAVAVLLSVLLYRHEESIEAGFADALGIDVVRVMGGLLGLAAVVLSAATWFIWSRGLPGLPIPVGVVLLYVFGGILLVVQRE